MKAGQKLLFLLLLSIIIFIASLPLPLTAHAAGGPDTASWYDGNEGADSYVITTADQLAGLAQLVNSGIDFEGKTITLGNSIDLAGYSSGTGWVPIGGYQKPFKGVFDGNYKEIMGLYINTTSDYSGLFGLISGTASKVKNLGIIDANVRGVRDTGGLASSVEYGNITNCYITGVINGYEAGGLVGSILVGSLKDCYSDATVVGSGNSGGLVSEAYDSSIINCYTTGAITGYSGFVGGIVGDVGSSSIQNCYATGKVTSRGIYTANAGGIAGHLSGGDITNCYATGTVGSTIVAGGIAGVSDGSISNCVALNLSIKWGPYGGRIVGINGGELSNNLAFEGMVNKNDSTTWDHKGLTDIDGADITSVDINTDGTFGNRFVNDGNPWTVEDSKLPGLFGSARNMAPHLKMAAGLGEHPFENGSGVDEENAYIIETAEQLAWLAEQINVGNEIYNNKYYELGADIDLSGYDESCNEGAGWIPIGFFSYYVFKGHFNGAGHIVSNLYINNGSNSYEATGLFGYVVGGMVKNVGVVGAVVEGGDNTGIVAGYVGIYGNVINCYSTGEVSGNDYVGGVVGRTYYYSSVTNCYSAGSVFGNDYVGGILGVGSVANCYSIGIINGNQYVGGISGGSGSVLNCAALNPSVLGTFTVGRVVGYSTTSSGNIAFEDILNSAGNTIWTHIGPENYDGLSKTALAIRVDGTLGGLFVEGQDSPWVVEDGRLPGLFRETVAMPVHLSGVPEILSLVPGEGCVIVKLARSKDVDAMLVITIYNDNKLISMKAEPVMPSGVMNVLIDIPEGAKTIQAMIWDDINIIQPLCPAKKIVNECGEWGDVQE